MLEDFLTGKLFIVLNNKDVNLLKELREVVGDITYANGTYIDGIITVEAIELYGEIGIHYETTFLSSERSLAYSMSFYKENTNVPLRVFLEEMKFKQFEISENEINTLFA